MREHLHGSEHLCNVVSFLLCVSQSVFGAIQRRLACPAQMLKLLSSFVLHSFCEFVCIFPFSSQGRDFILHCCSQLRTCLADC